MPVLNKLKFRKGLNKSLLVRGRAKSRFNAADFRFKRAEHDIKTLPEPKDTAEEIKRATNLKVRKTEQLDRFEMNKLYESVELSASNRTVNSFKNSRKKPFVGGIRLGRTIIDILLGSNKTSSVKKNIGRVFTVAKSAKKKKNGKVSKVSRPVTSKKRISRRRGSMLGKNSGK